MLRKEVDWRTPEEQCFGNWWRARPDDARAAEELLGGNLELPPHPVWNFGDRLDWSADPFAQKNWNFQLHCLKWLEPVRRTALLGTEEKEDLQNFWLNIVESWRTNFLEGNDEFAWMDMADGVRTIELVLGAPLVPDDYWDTYVSMLQKHQEKLADESRRAKGNHGLHQLQGYFVVSKFLRDDAGVESSTKDILRSFDEEYDAEGTNREGSLAYHDLNYFWWKECLERLRVGGGEVAEQSEVLERSRRNLSFFVRPDGFLETIGDTPPGRIMSDDGCPMSDYARSSGQKGIIPQKPSVVLSAGYACGRAKWGTCTEEFGNSSFYSLRFGNESIHGHDDGGSITLFSNGKSWVCDPGMYAYQSDEIRNYFKSRRSHNIVTDLGTNFRRTTTNLEAHINCDFFDSYLVRSESDATFATKRLFLYLRTIDVVIIVDEVESPQDTSKFPNPVQLWHFPPNVSVNVGLRAVSLKAENDHIKVFWLNRPRFEVKVGEKKNGQLLGWYSPRYAVAEPTKTLLVSPAEGAPAFWMCGTSLSGEDFWLSDFEGQLQDFKVQLHLGDLSFNLFVTDCAATILKI